MPPIGTANDYPLATRNAAEVKTPTGRHLDDITMEAVLAGDVTAQDLRISPDTLRRQAEIADSVGRRTLGENFRRAAELASLPDERVLEMYNALRPRASSRDALLEIARELREDYDAPLNARLVTEAAEVYEQRDVLAPASEEESS